MSEQGLDAVRPGARARTPESAAASRRLLDRAQRLATSSAALNPARAAKKVAPRNADTAGLYASVAGDHDMLEAWLGLACTHHLQADSVQAAEALGRALRGHAFVAETTIITQQIAQAAGTPGWCSLDGAGKLIVQLTRAPASGTRPIAILDRRPVTLRLQPSGLAFAARLPAGWERATELVVSLDGVPLLGSPVAIEAIVRVEGFVGSTDGDLHGWAWCPHDPDRDPVLSIEPLDGGPSITVVAGDRSIAVRHENPLARPRGFRIPPNQLRRFDGPVRVRGAFRDLTGSPLDPSAERRSAETATRILADLFPAPGQEGRPVPRDLAFLSVPAHMVGGPVEGGFNKRPVDVIIPVYGGIDLTLACLESVLTDLPRWARVIVIDDASPDARVALELDKFAARHRITLLSQVVNRGFPGTANIGMRNDAARDVVLLNSDTLVPPGWLASLRAAAYSAPDIGSATPFSNDATILSYPSVEFPNAMPDLDETIYIDALSQKANAGRIVDIPTAVGFCTYIKRDCLNATGLLREDLFAQGYGEENDFCIRARHLGWRHVAVPSMFVAHTGGYSFGARKHHLMERNQGTLNQLHPGYDALIRAFLRADPLAEPRRDLDLERWKTFRTPAKSVLLVTHGRAGGVRRHVVERAAALRAEGFRPIMIWPVASRHGGGRDCVLGNGPEGGTPNLRFGIPAELDLLTHVLGGDNAVRAEVHHMIGHDHQLMDLFRRLGIPYQIIVHDYSWLCPRINLMGAERRYCGEPDIVDCEACIVDAGPTNDENTPPRVLRERSEIEMACASGVVVSSEDVATRMRRHFPSIRTKIKRWEDDSVLPPLDPSPLAADGIRRICVLGAIGVEKGYDMLLACARDASKRKLKLRFQLVGHSHDDGRLLATGSVQITGEYDEQEVVSLIKQQQAQLAWLPSLWPETWCYTLTQNWQAGLNVLAFDIGTPAERIRGTGRGWIVPLGLKPERLNNRMLAL
ncbi:MAG: hypothetical protein QOH05_513 [Acetobacteraceae bacterium]|nr:hypothetical protein [Acetobacteraceae bacterium]